MLTELSLYELLLQTALLLLMILLGLILIWTTKNGTNILIDPPPRFESWAPKSFLWSMLGKKGEIFVCYVIGIVFILLGSSVLYERIVTLAQ